MTRNVKVCPQCGSIKIIAGGISEDARDMCSDCGYGDFRRGFVTQQGIPQFFPEIESSKVKEFQASVKKVKKKNK